MTTNGTMFGMPLQGEKRFQHWMLLSFLLQTFNQSGSAIRPRQTRRRCAHSQSAKMAVPEEIIHREDNCRQRRHNTQKRTLRWPGPAANCDAVHECSGHGKHTQPIVHAGLPPQVRLQPSREVPGWPLAQSASERGTIRLRTRYCIPNGPGCCYPRCPPSCAQQQTKISNYDVTGDCAYH